MMRHSNENNIHAIIQDEIGKVFTKVLECAGLKKKDLLIIEKITWHLFFKIIIGLTI